MQLPLQRHQRYENDVGVPVQVPAFAVSVCPTAGVPETVGGTVLLGIACASARAEALVITATSTAPVTSTTLATADHRRAERFLFGSIAKVLPLRMHVSALYRDAIQNEMTDGKTSQGAYGTRRFVYTRRTERAGSEGTTHRRP